MLVLDHDRMDEDGRALLHGLRVTQEMSGRVLIVEADSAMVERIRATAGVATPDRLDAAAYAGLTQAERIAVDAWRRRAEFGSKTRPGEGRSWGDKDFDEPR